jgi:Ni/Fe-hydrogenase subunit HybB-like protein
MLKIDPVDKERLIDPLFTTGPRFYALAIALSAVVAWGVFMYLRQVSLGLGETGMDRPVYWGVYMVNFIFFIGISHAGTLISAILRVTGAEWRRPITRVAEAITVFALLVGTLQIIIDMGRPDRLLYVLQYGRLQSPILWDVVSVTAYFLGSLMYLYLPLIPDAAIVRDNFPEHGPAWRRKFYTILALGWRGNREQWLRLEKAIGFMAILIIPVAISVHTIIAWILATTVQPGWHSSIFGPYFVVGAIFSGIGMLFLAMTAVRHVLHLEAYITLRQYRNLGLLFLTMTGVWAYFTFAEHLGIAAVQNTKEFPVLASKLWGQYATGFWGMVLLMGVAFWALSLPQMLPETVARLAMFRPRFALASSGGAAVVAFMLASPQAAPVTASLGELPGRALLWTLLALFVAGAGLAGAMWLKTRLVAATIVAALCVLVAMWLERWYIMIPTLTHPLLIPYASYRPTWTEAALTAGSLALFALLFLLFFKLFPAVSIWEVAEGRVIEKAHAQIEIPAPEPTATKQLRRWGFKK